MAWFYLILMFLLSFVDAQHFQLPNRLSVTLEEENLDDSITQIFNICQCVIFYQCDEENFIIPDDQIQHTQVTNSKLLRTIPRIKCSNEFYYCCKNKNGSETSIESWRVPVTILNKPHFTTVSPLYVPTSSSSNSNCGQVGVTGSRRIIDKFPWVVAIYQKRKTDNYRFTCGGSLIHPRVVMTEQQCVHSYPSNDFKVVAGREALGESVKLLSVSEIIKHEVYPSQGVDDIALVILQKPLTNARTICLPNNNQVFSGRRCTAIGWSGTTQSGNRKLRNVNLPIIDSQRCENLLRNTSLGSDFKVHPSYVCAGGEEGEETCKNDGGSPLMCEENGRYVQVGIVAWGLRCGQRDIPSLYTNVANLVSWIQQKLRDF